VPQSRIDPLIDTTLGHWRITRLLGRGGLAQVYEAIDPAGGLVAIEVMTREAAADADAVKRFFAEAQLAGVIAMAYLADGRPFIVVR
jgi:serine/threonine-protein kinase